ncbi:alkaline phosphatase family protein [Candidatus Marsarchaeota archaeon]|nr:alkaline phosphatase family protein [Candidatus Marsarchaeota archaeon]MCL5092495.1 alkaline phosphatase family protein [Candidatus Marsarchaeota archaeon]
MGKNELHIVGIDAAPLWIINRLSKKFGLEGFQSIMHNGKLGNLESTLPPMTGAAWPSIYTGMPPSKHGLMDFFTISRDYEKQLVYFDESIAEPFWKTLSKQGKKSLVITPAMVVRPIEDPNVDMITGFPLPSKFSSDKIKKEATKYGFLGEPDIEKDIKDGSMPLEEASMRFSESIKKRAELSKSLIKKGNYNLSFTCFTETDRLQHFALSRNDWEALVYPLYKEISDFIWWLINNTGAKRSERSIMIVSDHGAQPIYNKFLINSWLINKGYAKFKENIGDVALTYGAREKLMSSKALRKIYDKMPKTAKSLTRKMISSSGVRVKEGTYSRMHDFDLDMGNTQAFASISNDPVSMIWINDNRFSEPAVKQGEKAILKKELILGLKGLKTEKGEKLINKVIDGKAYYGSTNMFIAPDLLIEARKGYTIDVFNYSPERIFMKPEPAKSGDHIREGIFGFMSPNGKFLTDARRVKSVLDIRNMVLKVLSKD